MILKDYMEKYDLSPLQMALNLKVAVSTIYNLMKGKQSPNLALAIQIELFTQNEVTCKDLLYSPKIERKPKHKKKKY